GSAGQRPGLLRPLPGTDVLACQPNHYLSAPEKLACRFGAAGPAGSDDLNGAGRADDIATPLLGRRVVLVSGNTGTGDWFSAGRQPVDCGSLHLPAVDWHFPDDRVGCG